MEVFMLKHLFLAGSLLATGLLMAVDENFKPILQNCRLSSPVVRPGDQLILDLSFENTGSEDPVRQYKGFIHLENNKTDPTCQQISGLLDFGVDWWKVGGKEYRGVYSITIPENMPEGKRYIHTGLFLGDLRLCEELIAFTVDADAPPAEQFSAPELTVEELQQLENNLDNYFTSSIADLETDTYCFSVAADGRWQFVDKTSNEIYYSDLTVPALGSALFENNGSKKFCRINSVTAENVQEDSFQLRWQPPEVSTDVLFSFVAADERTLKVSWEQQNPSQWVLSDMNFPDEALSSGSVDGGLLIIPNRLGILMLANENLPGKLGFLTYDGYGGLSMGMGGVARPEKNSGILLHWNDVDTTLTGHRIWGENNMPSPASINLTVSSKGSSGAITLVNAASGDYCKITNLYRDAAREKGFLITMQEKYGDNNIIDGVMSFRPMAYYNFTPNTRWNSSDKRRGNVGFSFAETAETAEYIHNILGIEKVMITFMGWGNRGYDHVHPDILPANPEAGGNEGLRDAVQRIRNLDYIVGLHDNYGDFYPDAPSFEEKYILQQEDGQIRKGGIWWGGQCYLANPKYSLKFARRNLPWIKELFPLNYYYIDTTFAVPLNTDCNPDDPMDREGDMRRKQALCNFARETFGLFGSEEGVEWGVPVADYAESMLFQRTKRMSGEVLVPLFEMVYGDAISIHEGDRTLPTTPTYVLDHLICAEMPQLIFNKYPGADISCSIRSASLLSNSELQLLLEWKAANGVPKKDYKIAIHADKTKQSVGYTVNAFSGTDYKMDLPMTQWKSDQPITETRVLSAENWADGRYDIFAMILDGERVAMRHAVDSGHSRYMIGHVEIANGKVVAVDPPQPLPESCFSRLDSRPELSWTNEGFMINLYQIFAPIMERTRNHYLSAHKFLTEDRSVEQSQFGPVVITVNYGDKPFEIDGFILPKWGFLATDNQGFQAYRAIVNNQETLRSGDFVAY